VVAVRAWCCTPVLAQLAELSGVRGVSFWIAAINGLIADAWLLRTDRSAIVKRAIAVVLIFVTVVGYGVWRMSSISLTPFAKVSIIQPNIPERAKLDIENPTEHVGIMTGMTRTLLRDSTPDLVVWPEAALDRFLWQYPHWRDSLQFAVIERPTPILTGLLDSYMPDTATFNYYNAAVVTNPYGWISERPYRKEFLVPIVERVPFLNPEWFRRLDYFGGYSRGVDNKPFQLPFGLVGVMICYESIFPQLARSYAQQNVSLIANITNDAWFQRSNAPYQHFSHMILRAIETRLPVVRSANTGVSGYIDPLGRVRSKTEIFVPAAETYQVESAGITTLYTRFGDWIGFTCLAITGAIVVAAWRASVKRKKGSTVATTA
jgi:apolipoprotein N-acyltransferase